MKSLFRTSLLLLFFLTILLILWLFFISLPLWSVQHVLIKDNAYIPQALILEKLVLPEKTSIFKANTALMRKEILVLPWVKNVIIHRHYPATLLIQVIPRQPYFQLPVSGHIWVLDPEGAILNRDNLTVQGYPLYEIIGLSSLADIEQLLPDLLVLCAELDKSVGSASLKISKIDCSRKNKFTLISSGQVKIKIGAADYASEKVRALKQIWRVLESKINQVEYIDLRAYKTPAVKMKAVK